MLYVSKCLITSLCVSILKMFSMSYESYNHHMVCFVSFHTWVWLVSECSECLIKMLCVCCKSQVSLQVYVCHVSKCLECLNINLCPIALILPSLIFNLCLACLNIFEMSHYKSVSHCFNFAQSRSQSVFCMSQNILNVSVQICVCHVTRNTNPNLQNCTKCL